jgi:hypothetical protein
MYTIISIFSSGFIVIGYLHELYTIIYKYENRSKNTIWICLTIGSFLAVIYTALNGEFYIMINCLINLVMNLCISSCKIINESMSENTTINDYV